VPAEVRTSVEAKVTAVRKALEGSDIEAVTRATNELYQAVQAIGSAMYEGAAGGAPGGGPGGPGDMGGGPEGMGGSPDGGAGPAKGSGGDDVVEGEFKEA
ncbi:MAG: hypothetical protein ABI847_19140, partial [Anaerolineales bacterium]